MFVGPTFEKIEGSRGPMRYYPVFLDLQEASCLVVGGGQVGERKVKTLLSCGAKVHLVSLNLTPSLEEEVRQGRVRLLGPEFLPEHLEGMFLVIGATDDPEVNRRISLEARSRNLLCNIVDKPRECNFIVPSQVHRGDLVIAVSTGGRSPALAKKIRQDLEILFPDIYSIYVTLLGRVREYILEQGFTQAKNQKIFESLIESPILEGLRRGDREDLTKQLMGLLDPPPQAKEVENWLRE
jgi:precorrin-2 dehydrogenase/sirohydrochlorin ferrochelatase